MDLRWCTRFQALSWGKCWKEFESTNIAYHMRLKGMQEDKLIFDQMDESFPPYIVNLYHTYSNNTLLVPGSSHSGYGMLSPSHRGISYPPPSPTRATLRRGFAFSASIKNPPLLKTRNITSQNSFALLPSTSCSTQTQSSQPSSTQQQEITPTNVQQQQQQQSQPQQQLLQLQSSSSNNLQMSNESNV